MNTIKPTPLPWIDVQRTIDYEGILPKAGDHIWFFAGYRDKGWPNELEIFEGVVKAEPENGKCSFLEWHEDIFITDCDGGYGSNLFWLNAWMPFEAWSPENYPWYPYPEKTPWWKDWPKGMDYRWFAIRHTDKPQEIHFGVFEGPCFCCNDYTESWAADDVNQWCDARWFPKPEFIKR